MFNPTQVVIEAFVRELQAMYVHTYSVLEPIYPDVIAFIARAVMENIANSDAPYHNAEHTMMVTLVGQEILRGKHIREGALARTIGCTSSVRSCAMTSAMCAGSV
jgi:hypothetical protein